MVARPERGRCCWSPGHQEGILRPCCSSVRTEERRCRVEAIDEASRADSQRCERPSLRSRDQLEGLKAFVVLFCFCRKAQTRTRSPAVALAQEQAPSPGKLPQDLTPPRKRA